MRKKKTVRLDDAWIYGLSNGKNLKEAADILSHRKNFFNSLTTILTTGRCRK